MNKKERKFNKILKGIKEIKIQGAKNVAKQAFIAYSLIPTKDSKKKLLESRPTEPMMENVLEMVDKKIPSNKILSHFEESQEKINKNVLKLLQKNEIIFTHCHSTNVVNALVYSKKNGKNFEVYNTETRPLFQGRKTAKELTNAKIRTTMFVDSALDLALSGKQTGKKVTKIFLGADALLKKGIINKIGSGLIAKIAKQEKIPIYVLADSWKFTKNKISIEQRNLNEIWDKAPKKIKINNPAFEFVDKKYIFRIISDLGILKYDKFIERMN